MAFSSHPTLIPAYHVLVKPTGALCNLDCKYCFYLTKSELYPGSDFRMPDEVLETYMRQLCESQRGPQVSLAFQGGEPTLMGLDYFRRAVQLAERVKRPGQRVEYSLQTNGVLLDDEWGEFLSEQRFQVGLSLDGPSELHDVYRVDQGGAPSFQRALAGLRVLQKYQVEYNLLCSVHAANSNHGLRVYRYFRDELGAQYLQFIPIVERTHQNGSREGELVTERSVRPEQWGDFLVQIFDEWVRRDVGKVYVTVFESALANWLGLPAGICIFNATCGKALALEHNGDLYACDHFVEPDYLLGNIREVSMAGLVASQQQRDFGRAKRDSLPKYCRECPVRFACHGECPKNRFTPTPDGEPGLNYLCAGYRRFFENIDGPMRFMVEELHQQRSPQGVMRHMKHKR
jgi:uncharacterized protein